MSNIEKIDFLEKEIRGLKTEISILRSFNDELVEKLDEIWKTLTSLSLDIVANKANIDLVCKELIKKERVI